MKSEFDKLCENFNVIKKTTRQVYPKQIKFSPTFEKALKQEFFRQKLDEDVGEIRNHKEKFLKAVNFKLYEYTTNQALELKENKRKLQEMDAGHKKPGKPGTPGNKLKSKVKGGDDEYDWDETRDPHGSMSKNKGKPWKKAMKKKGIPFKAGLGKELNKESKEKDDEEIDAKKSDINKDGKLSGWEQARSKAIAKNQKKGKKKEKVDEAGILKTELDKGQKEVLKRNAEKQSIVDLAVKELEGNPKTNKGKK